MRTLTINLIDGSSFTAKGYLQEYEGVKYLVHKVNTKWQSTEVISHGIIQSATTKKETICRTNKLIQKHGIGETKKVIRSQRKRLDSGRKRNRYWKSDSTQQAFKKYFGVHIGRFCDTWITGFTGVATFDVISFDKFIRTPDSVSMMNFITKKYGIKAMRLIKSLI